MDQQKINSLDEQINILLSSCEQIKIENQSLRHKLTKLSNENATLRHEQALLRDKNKKAAIKIKHLISQLKEEIQ